MKVYHPPTTMMNRGQRTCPRNTMTDRPTHEIEPMVPEMPRQSAEDETPTIAQDGGRVLSRDEEAGAPLVPKLD
jgi:hypothetical protein